MRICRFKATIDLHLNCLCLESRISEGVIKRLFSLSLSPPLFVYHWVLRFTSVFQALEGGFILILGRVGWGQKQHLGQSGEGLLEIK